MKQLIMYNDYTRKDVHDIFDPLTVFTPQTGLWGISGIVKIPDQMGNFVFFVTYGRSQGGHNFDEGITEDGILTWQSQPRQGLDHPTISQLINHDHYKNTIYLFLRTHRDRNYTYLGTLAYLTHDSEREKPVHFKWQILNWNLSKEKAQEIGLQLHTVNSNDHHPIPVEKGLPLVQSDPPKPRQSLKGRPTREFRGNIVDFGEENSKKNAVGLSGEKLVLQYEIDYLTSHGRKDLADKVTHISLIDGDGAGYDILSFTLDGQKKYIEVKTTSKGKGTPFFLSSNELAFSQSHNESYYLYRLYNFNHMLNQGEFYIIQGDISTKVSLEPIQFKARL